MTRWIGWAALASLFWVPPLRAADRRLDDWANLDHLRPGQRIEVIGMNLKRTRGVFVSAAPDEIRLSVAGTAAAMPRTQVFRVSLLENSKRLRNVLIGIAAGAAAGLAAGAAVDSSFSEDNEHLAKMLLAPVGIGAGAAVGAAVPAFETIYRASKRAPSSSGKP